MFGLFQEWSRFTLLDWIAAPSTGANASFAAALGCEVKSHEWLRACKSQAFVEVVLDKSIVRTGVVREHLLSRTVTRAAVIHGRLKAYLPKILTISATPNNGGHPREKLSLALKSTSYCSCAAAPNGRVYFVPKSAAQVLCVDPADGTVRDVGPSDLGISDNKYAGSVTRPDGLIYCILVSRAVR